MIFCCLSVSCVNRNEFEFRMHVYPVDTRIRFRLFMRWDRFFSWCKNHVRQNIMCIKIDKGATIRSWIKIGFLIFTNIQSKNIETAAKYKRLMVLWSEGTGSWSAHANAANIQIYSSDDLSEWMKFQTLQLRFYVMFLWPVSVIPYLPRLSDLDFRNKWFSFFFLSAGARAQLSFFSSKFNIRQKKRRWNSCILHMACFGRGDTGFNSFETAFSSSTVFTNLNRFDKCTRLKNLTKTIRKNNIDVQINIKAQESA